MKLFEYIKMSFSALRQNRTRAVLTMIGIIVGISSIVTISTLGSTIKETVQNMAYKQSLNTFRVSVVPRPGVNVAMPEKADGIQYGWFSELQKEYPDEFRSSVLNFYDYASAGTCYNTSVDTEICAVTDGFFECNKINILSGRGIIPVDMQEKKYIAIVSDIFVKQYFKNGTNPLGKTITLVPGNKRSLKFTVVGVYETNPYDYPNTGSINDVLTDIYIPYDTGMQLSAKIKDNFGKVDIVGSRKYSRTELIGHLNKFFEKKYLSREFYHVRVYDVQQDAEATEKVVTMIVVVIGVIAAVSLFVAGIGVMNIMLVSISERTQEIGIRKALGAQNRNILLQFSVESVIICLIGGFFGLLFGTANCNIAAVSVNKFSSSLGEFAGYIGAVSRIPDIQTILIALIFSCVVGILSGIYPAMRAAKMNPIDALRHE